MEHFLASVERKAFRVAEMSVKNTDDALDIVQDAMFKLVQKYSDKPKDQWNGLFWRILYNRINDFHRGSSLKSRFFGWLERGVDQQDQDDQDDSYLDGVADSNTEPDAELINQINAEEITSAIKQLSPQQQQAFLLRQWHNFDVKQTAEIMGCSDGSVKTHYSRAVHGLRHILVDQTQ